MTSSPINIGNTAATQDTAPMSAQNGSFVHNEVKGRFNQFTSGFWALALPALSARYLGRYIVDMDLRNERPVPKKEERPNRTYGTLVGLWMLGITGFYASRTWADMKRVFSETLAYEFDKKADDVNIRDFFKSKNAIVHQTLQKFLKYNFRRVVVGSTFFMFLMPWKFKTSKADSVDLGVGATGAYLFTDVIGRKITFFEALQNFIDNKINHSDSVGQVITNGDLMNLYAIHVRDNTDSYLTSGNLASDKIDTLEWKKDQIIFGRMADLMNQTYRNTVNKEQANFTVPKLLYLLGNNLIRKENAEQSLVYIEIANHYGIQAVKEVEKGLHRGVKFKDAISKFPITLPTQENKKPEEPNRVVPSHVDRLSELKQKEAAQTDFRSV